MRFVLAQIAMRVKTVEKKVFSRNQLLLSLLVLSTILISPRSSSAENGTNVSGAAQHLFAYKKDFIMAYLSKAGYSDIYLDKIERNSTGTNLYIHHHYANRSMGILSISVGGKINKLIPPAKFAYLNDQEEFVAWFDDIKQEIHFRGGTTLKSPLLGMIFSSFEIDPSGKLFFIKKDANLVELASTDNPDKALFHSNIEAEKIYLKAGKVYLFARSYRNVQGRAITSKTKLSARF